MPKKPAFSPYSTTYSDYKAYWLARAAQRAYSGEAKIRSSCQAMGLNDVVFISDKKTGTQVFVAWASTFIVVSFRGTEVKKWKDIESDVKVRKNKVEWGHVHRGFYQGWKSVEKRVNQALKGIQKDKKRRSLWLTGHSLGAALASVMAMDRAVAGLPIDGVYTFGQPRVFSNKTAERYNRLVGDRTFRFVNNNDTVTRVAPRIARYGHVGSFRYFDKKGKLHDDIGYWNRFLDRVGGRVADLLKPGTDGLKDHGIKNYVNKLGWRYNKTKS